MVTLLFFAVGVFFNPTTGDSQDAVQQVASVTECANTINAFLDGSGGIVHAETGDYYLIQADCEIAESSGE